VKLLFPNYELKQTLITSIV